MGDEADYLEDGADYYDIYGCDCDMDCEYCDHQSECDEFH